MRIPARGREYISISMYLSIKMAKVLKISFMWLGNKNYKRMREKRSMYISQETVILYRVAS